MSARETKSSSGERGLPLSHVLDSYAVLAWLQGEPGGAVVADLLQRARQGGVVLGICGIDLGEVLYVVEREVSVQAAQIVLATIDSLPIVQIDASKNLTLQAVHFKAVHHVSYADCFAMALAKQFNALLVTGDPELETQDEVRLLWMGS
jgi:ribonuclease VapC